MSANSAVRVFRRPSLATCSVLILIRPGLAIAADCAALKSSRVPYAGVRMIVGTTFRTPDRKQMAQPMQLASSGLSRAHSGRS